MPFGQAEPVPKKPSRMTWNGTRERARELADWGRDDALLPIVAVTPPTLVADPETPAGQWQVKALVAVAPELGGGVTWKDVPVGAVIRNTNTGPNAWVDPVLEVVTARPSAAAFQE